MSVCVLTGEGLWRSAGISGSREVLGGFVGMNTL